MRSREQSIARTVYVPHSWKGGQLMPESEPPVRLSFELSLFADYHQFYLQDEPASGDLSRSWDAEAMTRLLAVAPDVIGVRTARNMIVPVKVKILDSSPPDDFTFWDQVVEASINISSGRVVIAGCTDYFPDAMCIPVEPGIYRVRIYYGGLASISEDGLEGEDHYQVVLWPEKYSAPKILKKWSS
jgi:hypothetical protein